MVPVAWPWRMGKRVEMAISVDPQGFGPHSQVN